MDRRSFLAGMGVAGGAAIVTDLGLKGLEGVLRSDIEESNSALELIQAFREKVSRGGFLLNADKSYPEYLITKADEKGDTIINYFPGRNMEEDQLMLTSFQKDEHGITVNGFSVTVASDGSLDYLKTLNRKNNNWVQTGLTVEGAGVRSNTTAAELYRLPFNLKAKEMIGYLRSLPIQKPTE